MKKCCLSADGERQKQLCAPLRLKVCYSVMAKRRVILQPVFFADLFLWSLFAGRAWFLSYHVAGLRVIMCEVGSRLVFGEIVGSRERLLSLRGFKSNETGVNWRKVKAEYIAGGISQKALCKKYGISEATMARRSKLEKWTAQRKQAENKAIEKVSEKTADEAADNAVILQRIKRKLLQKVEGMIDNFPETNAGEKRERIGNADYIYKIKDLAAVYSALEDKTIKANVDIEDLTPLTELLRGE